MREASLIPLPSSFPVPFFLSPPSFPLLTFPFPLSRYHCDLPQPFCSRGRESKRSGRVRGWEEWEGEREGQGA